MRKIFTMLGLGLCTLSMSAQLIWEGSFEQTPPAGQQDAFLAVGTSVVSRVAWEGKMATDSYWNNLWVDKNTEYNNKMTIVSDAHSGSQAILFEISHVDKGNRLRSTVKDYTAGDWVKATFWAKTDAAGVAKGGKLIGLFENYSQELTTEYQEFVSYGQIGGSGRIELWFPDAGTSEVDNYKVWLDDVSLEWAPSGPPYMPDLENFPCTEDFESNVYVIGNEIAKQNATDGELDSWPVTTPQVFDRFWRGNNTTEYLATVDGDAYDGSKAMKLAIETKLDATAGTAYDFRLRTVNLPEGDYKITLYAKTDAAGEGIAKIGFTSEADSWETLTTEYKEYSGVGNVTINPSNNTGRLIVFYTSDPTLTVTQSYNMWIDGIKIEEGTATAIEDKKAEQVSLYPNPVGNELFINTAGRIDQVELYSLSGQCLKVVNEVSGAINTNELPQGIYIASITVDGQTLQKKFIKK
ncbi:MULTISPECIES: T9SS type A sorting domain-containing protein [unclassified Carboxylicivirga]|uniref:T9SS type A sorting domain-containing protein n=1 Tax=Carboxylicivirga TaxID=1628153 RepID=UPI003D357501